MADASDASTYRRSSGPPDRRLRVSDAEREAVAGILRREHVAGRLDNDEFDERLTRCLAAKTYADLDELIADFPAEEPVRRGARRSPRPRLLFLLLPLIALIAVASDGRALVLVAPLFLWFVVRPIAWRGDGWGCRPYSRARARG
jgi:Domain of unknown function (DUF1707)